MARGRPKKVIQEEVAPRRNSEEFVALTNPSHFLSDKIFKQNMMNSLPSANKILAQNGGVKCLYDLYQDNEIIKSDVDKRIASITCTNYNIETESEVVRDLLEQNIGPCYYDLTKSIAWSIFYGYSVTELVWNQELATNNETYILDQVFTRDPHLFRPLFDLRSCIYLGERQLNKKVAPFGKYLLTCNEGTPENPYGDALLTRLYWLELYRKKALNYWIKALERYGYPFLYGKTDFDKVEMLNEILEQAREGSAITTDHDTNVELLSANINTTQFVEFENSIRQRIHLCILGQNLTSEVSSGSLAAAQVHKQVAVEKTKADVHLVENTLNRLIRIILVLNGLQNETATINIEVNEGLEIERAQRDEILCRTGKIRLTEEYYRKNYDLEDEDFEIVNTPVAPVNFMKNEVKRLELQERNLTPEVQELEDLTNYLAGRADTIFNIEELVSTIQSSGNKKELTEGLSALSSNPDISFEEILTEAYYFALVRGAIDGRE